MHMLAKQQGEFSFFMLSDDEFEYFCVDNVMSYILNIFCNIYKNKFCDTFSTKI